MPDPPAYEVRRAGLTEQVKDRWNGEIEKLVHNVQTTDWVAVREDAEAKIATAWSSLRQTEQAQKLEQSLKENVDAATDKAKQVSRDTKQNVKEATEQARDQARKLGQDAEDNLRSAASQARDQARSAASQARDQARQVGQDVKENISNVTDQAKQYGRDVKDNLMGVSEEAKSQLESAKVATGQRRLLEIS